MAGQSQGVNINAEDILDATAGAKTLLTTLVPAEYEAATGTAARVTFATYDAEDISAVPTEAEVQAIADHVEVLSQTLKALIDDLIAQGILAAAP